MSIKNRILCAASLGSNGAVILGAAKVGFRTLATGWGAVDGDYPYLLEHPDGIQWELGLVRVVYGNQLSFAGKPRLILDSSSGTGFANSTTGLVFSQGSTASSAWAGGNGSSPPKAMGNSLAAGDGAEVLSTTFYDGVAIGSASSVQNVGGSALGVGATVLGKRGAAIGNEAISTYAGETALGSNYQKASIRFLPMASVIYAAGVAPFTTVDPSASTINFATWSPNNKQNGALRIHGTATFEDGSNPGDPAYARVFKFEYCLWCLLPSSLSVLGTPTFTLIFSGASAVATTLTVDTSTGGLVMNTPGAGYILGRAIATIDNLANA